MSHVRVSLFGKLSIRCGDGGRAAIEPFKAQELLCFLLLHRDRPQPRELLAGTLWADQPVERGRQYLRKALWQLQSSLNEEQPGDEPALLVGQDDIAVNDSADIWTDVAAFEAAFTAAKGVIGRQLAPVIAERLSNAVALYRGELLEGWYQEWCVVERERCEVILLTMLDKLVAFSESRRDFERAIEHSLMILGRDRAREHTHRALMRLYYLAGDRTGALRQYQRCVLALHEELDVPPSPQTVALFERIRAGSSGPMSAFEASETGSPPNNGGLHSLAASLEQIESALHAVRLQLARKIDPSNRTNRH